MFESLSQRLSTTIERLRGRARLTEANIRESLREVRVALLEADVALPVVQQLIQRVQAKAMGQEVLKSLTPGQALVRVVRDELTGETARIRARAVVNAAGVWAGGLVGDIRLRPSRGTHLVLRAPDLGGLGAGMHIPIPGESSRFVLVLPQDDGRV